MSKSSKSFKGLTIAGVIFGFLLLVLLNGAPPSGSVALAQGNGCIKPDERVPKDPAGAKVKPQFCRYDGLAFIPITVPAAMVKELSDGLGKLKPNDKNPNDTDASKV